MSFYQKALKSKPKNSFSAAPYLGFAPLDQCKNWSPSGHQGVAAARATYGLLKVDENTLCSAFMVLSLRDRDEQKVSGPRMKQES